jgi:hypothetical protein
LITPSLIFSNLVIVVYLNNPMLISKKSSAPQKSYVI